MPIRVRDVQPAQPPRPANPTLAPAPAETASPRNRVGLRFFRRTYRRVGTTLALCGAGVLAALIWYYSSIFTLDYLGDTFNQVAALIESEPRWIAFLIPATVTAIEIFLWPQRERRLEVFVLRLLVWLFILLADVFTTYRGVLPLVQGVQLPFKVNIAQREILDNGASLVIGGLFAILPEKILRWVLHDMWELWVGPLVRWFKENGQPHPAA